MPLSRAHVRRTAHQLLHATANPDAPGVLLRGREHQPVQRDAFDPLVLQSMLRLARLAAAAADRLKDHPDPAVRRSLAVLAARAHPLIAAFD